MAVIINCSTCCKSHRLYIICSKSPPPAWFRSARSFLMRRFSSSTSEILIRTGGGHFEWTFCRDDVASASIRIYLVVVHQTEVLGRVRDHITPLSKGSLICDFIVVDTFVQCPIDSETQKSVGPQTRVHQTYIVHIVLCINRQHIQYIQLVALVVSTFANKFVSFCRLVMDMSYTRDVRTQCGRVRLHTLFWIGGLTADFLFTHSCGSYSYWFVFFITDYDCRSNTS